MHVQFHWDIWKYVRNIIQYQTCNPVHIWHIAFFIQYYDLSLWFLLDKQKPWQQSQHCQFPVYIWNDSTTILTYRFQTKPVLSFQPLSFTFKLINQWINELEILEILLSAFQLSWVEWKILTIGVKRKSAVYQP